MKLLPFSIVIPILAASIVSAEISSECKDALHDRNATILVPNGAGGGYDTYARSIKPFLEEQTGLNIRVVNNESGGGRVAYNMAVNASPDDLVILVGNMTDLALTPLSTDNAAPILASLDVLSIIHTEPRVWVFSDDLDLSSPHLTHLVSAEGSIEDGIIAVTLVGKALGIDTEIVSGYGGSSEFFAAVLRGEADMLTTSLQTGMKRTEGVNAHIALVLGNEINDMLPSVPYLMGEGGLVDIRSQGMPDAVKEERQYYAKIAMNLAQSVRGFTISNGVPTNVTECLRDAYSEVVNHREFVDDLIQQGRPVNPMSTVDSVNYSKNLLQVVLDSGPIISQLLAEQEGN